MGVVMRRVGVVVVTIKRVGVVVVMQRVGVVVVMRRVGTVVVVIGIGVVVVVMRRVGAVVVVVVIGIGVVVVVMRRVGVVVVVMVIGIGVGVAVKGEMVLEVREVTGFGVGVVTAVTPVTAATVGVPAAAASAVVGATRTTASQRPASTSPARPRRRSGCTRRSRRARTGGGMKETGWRRGWLASAAGARAGRGREPLPAAVSVVGEAAGVRARAEMARTRRGRSDWSLRSSAELQPSPPRRDTPGREWEWAGMRFWSGRCTRGCGRGC